ncbi:MAG: hypothetical protein CM1200mP22_32520 [Dehalococcoidia bacterium]|nr:MAG: hypothetical protein CM1200mP22_32520 [Dehalococcoidia bacterium]
MSMPNPESDSKSMFEPKPCKNSSTIGERGVDDEVSALFSRSYRSSSRSKRPATSDCVGYDILERGVLLTPSFRISQAAWQAVEGAENFHQASSTRKVLFYLEVLRKMDDEYTCLDTSSSRVLEIRYVMVVGPS